MLRYSKLKTDLAAVHSEIVSPLMSHLEQFVESIVHQASSIASREDRAAVTIDDLSSAFQNVYHTRKTQQGGAFSHYDGFCGGHDSQCGVVRNATCVFSGGRRSSKAPLRKQAQKYSHRRSTHRRRRPSIHTHDRGGVISYTGFCDGETSQCSWSDTQPGGASGQCGAGQKKNIYPRTRRNKRKQKTTQCVGGQINYNGFCDGNLSQCSWGDSLPSSSTPCTGGHRLYSKYRKQPSRRHAKKTRGGQLSVGFVNTTVLRHEMMQKYNVKWTSKALHFLQQALTSHCQELIDNIHEKLHELNDDPKNISNATVSVLRDYQHR